MFGVPMETVCICQSLDSSGYFCPSTTPRMRTTMRSDVVVKMGRGGKGREGRVGGKSRQAIP